MHSILSKGLDVAVHVCHPCYAGAEVGGCLSPSQNNLKSKPGTAAQACNTSPGRVKAEAGIRCSRSPSTTYKILSEKAKTNKNNICRKEKKIKTQNMSSIPP